MRDLFVTFIVFGSLPLILWRPFYGIIIWIWLSYMNPHLLGWGFASSMPFAMLVAVATLVGLLFSSETKKIPWTRETAVLLLFIIWMCLTTPFAIDIAGASAQLNKVLKIQLMTFVTMILLTQRDRIHAVVWAVALSLGFYGVKGGIFTIASGGGYHVWGPEGSFIGGNNELGLALLMTIPLMRYLQLQESRRWLKLGLTGAMVLTLFAVLGTQSRGALVGLAAVGIMLAWKSPQRARIFMLFLAVIPVALAFMPDSWWERMGTISNYEEDASAMGRIEAWIVAFHLAASNFMGGGFEGITASGVRDVHSIYFEVLGEHGFIGFFLFAMLLSFTWSSAGWVIRHAQGVAELAWAENLARMLQVSGLAYCTSGAFLGMAYFDYIYLLIAITVATRRLVEQHLATSSAASRGKLTQAARSQRLGMRSPAAATGGRSNFRR